MLIKKEIGPKKDRDSQNKIHDGNGRPIRDYEKGSKLKTGWGDDKTEIPVARKNIPVDSVEL